MGNIFTSNRKKTNTFLENEAAKYKMLEGSVLGKGYVPTLIQQFAMERQITITTEAECDAMLETHLPCRLPGIKIYIKGPMILGVRALRRNNVITNITIQAPDGNPWTSNILRICFRKKSEMSGKTIIPVKIEKNAEVNISIFWGRILCT